MMAPIKPGNLDEYIATFPKEVQEILQHVRTTVKEAAPGAQETIKYNMPTFTLNGNLVHFAAFKNHIGFTHLLSGWKNLKKNYPFTNKEKAPYNFLLTNQCP